MCLDHRLVDYVGDTGRRHKSDTWVLSCQTCWASQKILLVYEMSQIIPQGIYNSYTHLQVSPHTIKKWHHCCNVFRKSNTDDVVKGTPWIWMLQPIDNASSHPGTALSVRQITQHYQGMYSYPDSRTYKCKLVIFYFFVQKDKLWRIRHVVCV